MPAGYKVRVGRVLSSNKRARGWVLVPRSAHAVEAFCPSLLLLPTWMGVRDGGSGHSRAQNDQHDAGWALGTPLNNT